MPPYRQNSMFDQVSSIVSVIGFSLPTFFTGVLLIQIFAVWLGWFPTLYNTTLRVNSIGTFGEQLRQMVMPVAVLAFFQMAATSRFTRSSVIENLRMDYVRTARSKGLDERAGRGAPCGAQQHDPGGDVGGAGHSRHLWRRHRHRADLRRQRDRATADHVDPEQ